MFLETKRTARAVFSLFTWALIFFGGGCAGTRPWLDSESVDSSPRWKISREKWMEKVASDPQNSDREILKLIRLSSSPVINGEENETHGKILSELKRIAGEHWSSCLNKAGKRSRENALILIEAFESGTGFSLFPDVIMLSRDPGSPLQGGSVRLDLGG